MEIEKILAQSQYVTVFSADATIEPPIKLKCFRIWKWFQPLSFDMQKKTLHTHGNCNAMLIIQMNLLADPSNKSM